MEPDTAHPVVTVVAGLRDVGSHGIEAAQSTRDQRGGAVECSPCPGLPHRPPQVGPRRELTSLGADRVLAVREPAPGPDLGTHCRFVHADVTQLGTVDNSVLVGRERSAQGAASVSVGRGSLHHPSVWRAMRRKTGQRASVDDAATFVGPVENAGPTRARAEGV